MSEDPDLGQQLAEICEKVPEPSLPCGPVITREIALNVVKEYVTQGRAHLTVDPETNATRTLVYCVLGDNSQRVKQMNENYKHYQEETLYRLSFKSVSQPLRCKRDQFLARVMAIKTSDPSVSDLVSKQISYQEFVKQNPQFGYDNWDKLIDVGLTKAHILRDKWIGVRSLLDLCGDHHGLFSKLVGDLGFSAEDLLCTRVFGNGAIVLHMKVTHKHLSEVGLTRDILLSEDCKISLRSMVGILKFRLDVLETRYGFDASAFKTMLKLQRMNGWEEFRTLFGKDPREHFEKKKSKTIKHSNSTPVVVPLQTITIHPMKTTPARPARKTPKSISVALPIATNSKKASQKPTKPVELVH